MVESSTRKNHTCLLFIKMFVLVYISAVKCVTFVNCASIVKIRDDRLCIDLLYISQPRFFVNEGVSFGVPRIRSFTLW